MPLLVFKNRPRLELKKGGSSCSRLFGTSPIDRKASGHQILGAILRCLPQKEAPFTARPLQSVGNTGVSQGHSCGRRESSNRKAVDASRFGGSTGGLHTASCGNTGPESSNSMMAAASPPSNFLMPQADGFP